MLGAILAVGGWDSGYNQFQTEPMTSSKLVLGASATKKKKKEREVKNL
jgi:hypothetical protein